MTDPGTGRPSAPTVAVDGLCPRCDEPVTADTFDCPGCGFELIDRRIGKTIAERYRIESLLGAGGFGRVYRGTHLGLNEPVAVKFLLAQWSDQGELRARFRREAVALARPRHPSIVAIHDYGEWDKELFMVMELVRGKPLSKLIGPEMDPPDVARVLGLMDQVLQVLESAHAVGIVHRDLKPENVMLLDTEDRSDHVKVLDFGLALMDDSDTAARLTKSQAIQGTPPYLSPEQCRGRDVGPKSDVYALGVMMFELLAGRLPFDDRTAAELIVKHMFVEPPRIADVGWCREVPPPVERLVRHALAKQADARPDAAQLRDELRAVLEGRDAYTLAERSNEARIAYAGLGRDARAIPLSAATAIPSAQVREMPTVSGRAAAAPQATDAARVVLWGVDDLRMGAVQSILGVNGASALPWRKPEAPPATVAGKPVKLVILGADGAAERIRALRAVAETARLPVLVMDVPGVEHTAALIRAGASDVVLAGAGDETLRDRAARILRRGR